MIYVIMPAYNEEKNLSSLIPNIDKALGDVKMEYKILVINDGSTDATGQVSAALSKRFPVEVLDHYVNKGIGAVFNTGLRYVIKYSEPEDVIVIIEADGTNDPSLIPSMVNNIMNCRYDVVIGSRYQRGGRYHHFPLRRLILSKGANVIFRILFPIKNVRDYTIFFRAYRAGILKRAFSLYGDRFINAKSFVCNAEVIVKLKPLGIKVKEIPMVYNYDLKVGKSKMKIKENLREYLYFLFSVWKLGTMSKGGTQS